jgi:predicted CopG family antitoxin
MYLLHSKYYSMTKRHTISINYNVYTRLRNQGKFGESFTDVIERILNFVERSD